jgi:hypothetical protein
MGRSKSDKVIDRKCNECKSDVYPGEQVLTCTTCQHPFHNDCIGIDRATFKKIQNQPNWTCSEKCKKALDVKKKSSSNAESLPQNPSNRDIFLAIKEIQNAQSFISDKYDELLSKVNNMLGRFEVMENRINKLEKENANLKSHWNKQKSEKAKSGQSDLNNNVIVSGVPNRIENIAETFNKIANGVINDYDVGSNVVSIERLFTPKLDENEDSAGNKKALDKIPIVVKFSSESSKAKFMESVKINKGVYTAIECGVSNDDSKIFIKDQISSYNMQLLKETKKLKVDGKVKFVWFQNGNVLVRQDETSKIIKIKSQEDFGKIN